MKEFKGYEHAQCIEIMVKAGADLSLVVDGCVTAFMAAATTSSFVNKIVHSQL
jgi:fructose-1,6-bisphosphatase/sedoheptulose 1,7-bisphosphatase-like protein